MTPISILLIEKDSVGAEKVRTTLQQLGHSLTGIAVSAVDAYRRVQEMRPDLVITAVDLKGKTDGFSAAGQIRSRWNVPAVFLLPSEDSAHVKKIEKTDAGGWITKDDSGRMIEAVLNSVLVRHRSAEAAGRCQAEALILQRQYQTFFENQLFGVWRVDFPEPIPITRSYRRMAERILETGYIADCNERILEMYGLRSRTRLIGTPIREVAADRHIFLERMAAVAANDFRAVSVETEELDPAGKSHWFRNCYFGNVRDQKLHWLWGFQLDISEQKEAEAALRGSEERFRNLAELLPEALFETDGQLELLFANQRAFELFGYSRGDLERGLNSLEMIAPADRPRAKANFRRRSDGGDPGVVEYTAIRKDGSTFPSLLHANTIFRDGVLQGIRGIIVDISERKEAEAVFRRQVLEQEIMLKVSQHVASSLDLDTVLQTISDGTAQLLDVETAAIYLADGDDLYLGATTPPLDPDMPDSLRTARLADHPTIKKAIEAKKPVTIYDTGNADLSPQEHMIVDLRCLRSLIFLPFEHENDVIGVLILGTVSRPRMFSAHEIDLCMTITNELALGIQNVRLHQGLVLYTQQLENEIAERRRAEAQVQKDLKEKEVLLKEIHHRVKNNLQVISSLLSLQAAKTENEQALRILEESRNRIHSIALVHDALYKSKEFTNVTFTAYIRDLVSRLIRTYMIDPGRVAHTIDVDEVSLGIDKAVPCGLVMNELISNALKHAFPVSLKRKGRLGIAVHALDTGEIGIRVADNGIGFPKELDIHHPETLGLKLVSMIVEDQLSGRIRLDRRGGTAITVTFNQQ
ncbi:PAS domain S-box protein [bacterium]|nr:PAS domain S-box protein [bacterium]